MCPVIVGADGLQGGIHPAYTGAGVVTGIWCDTRGSDVSLAGYATVATSQLVIASALNWRNVEREIR